MSEVGQQIIAAVRKAADDNPAYVYDKGTCQYIVDGAPACLVGQALWAVNLIDPYLEYQSVNGGGVDEILDHLDIELDVAEEDWLSHVQEAQDTKSPWGLAVQEADRLEAEEYDSE